MPHKYTPAGDIRQKTDNVRGNTYTYSYDKLHRLVEELAEGYLPPMANTTLDYTYDQGYQPHAVKQITLNGSAPFDYTYDDNGNMVAGPDFTNPAQVADRTIAYNGDNLPLSIVHNGTVSTEFVYDGDGKRAKKTVAGGDTTYYVSDHYEVKNGVATKYIFAGSRRIAKRTGNAIYYYHKDHLGSSTVMEARLGGAVESTDYLPFGGQREQSGASVTGYKYTDQELDPSTGLYNYDARLYDPVIGRFITADSIVPDWFNPQALNRYAYVLNNPLAYFDPSGHDAESAMLNWLKTKPRNRIGESRFNYATQKQEIEALAYVRQFQLRLRKMESDGVNVDDLSVDTLDQEYVAERESARGINAIIAGALFGPAAAEAKGTTNASKSGGDWAKLSGQLRDASKGKGNFGIGAGTRAEADAMGKAWVGEGYTVASDGKTLVSADKLRQYRPPSYKPRLDKVQANFEQRFSGQTTKQWQSNAHLDITD